MINWKKHCEKLLLVLSIWLFGQSAYKAQEIQGDPSKGESLFKTNCTACHALEKRIIGPALKGVVEKIQEEQGLGRDWLHSWIKDNKALRESGDKYANEVYNEYDQVEMQAFPNLSEQDIDDILAYTINPPEPVVVASQSAELDLDAIKALRDKESNAKIIMISLFFISGLLLWILVRMKQLVKLSRSEELSALDERKIYSFAELYAKYNVAGKVVIGILAFFAFYGVWNWMMWIGVDKGYKPEQPIYFSHKIHAGINKIDCQLCHSGAKYGKVSEIPSLNVCMNCHKSIDQYTGEYIEPGFDRNFYNSEIKKLYSAVGWDSEKMAYTGKETPVEWVRIHNMPDFVYFDHSQHVVAGEQSIIKSHNAKNPNDQIDVVCKACHGRVDTMNVVQMANNFTMGWCIECHRTTEVDMDNIYNQSYFEKLHDKLKKEYGSGAKITVDAIGGIECGKCHY